MSTAINEQSIREASLLLTLLSKEVDQKVASQSSPSSSTPTSVKDFFASDPESFQYTVAKEAVMDELASRKLNQYLEVERGVAQRFGLKAFTNEQLSEVSSLKKKLASDPQDSDSYNRLQTIMRRGADEKTYNDYVAELQSQARGSVFSSNAERMYLAISPNLFQTLGGSENYREGGWQDGQFYPAAMRENWMQNGLVVEVPKQRGIAQKLTSEVLYGKEVARKLESGLKEMSDWHHNITKEKVGSRTLVAVYGGLLAWTIWFKWIAINERELNRQKFKFAIRTMDEDAPLTAKQLAMLEKHAEWASSYYDE